MKAKIIGFFMVMLMISPISGATILGGQTHSDEDDHNITNIQLNIVRPRKGFFYICDREVTFIGITTIIGPRQGIEVWAEVDEKQRENVSHIEFYINGKIVGIGNWDAFRQYFTWRCNELGFGIWHLTAVAVCEIDENSNDIVVLDAGDDNLDQDSISLLYFNFRMLQPKK